MSKLKENLEKEVPRRVALLTPLVTAVLFGATFLFEFNFLLAALFLWVATLANVIAFRLLVKGADRMITKREAGERATILPNLLIRYVLYGAVLSSAWLVGGLSCLLAAFVGVQMSQIVIKMDSIIG